MSHGGKRPGAGRPRGSTNKFSAEIRAAAATAAAAAKANERLARKVAA